MWLWFPIILAEKRAFSYEIFNQFFPKNKITDFFAIEDPIVGIRTIIQELS